MLTSRGRHPARPPWPGPPATKPGAPDGPPPAHGIVFGLVLALPFWCCFGVLLWFLG